MWWIDFARHFVLTGSIGCVLIFVIFAVLLYFLILLSGLGARFRLKDRI